MDNFHAISHDGQAMAMAMAVIMPEYAGRGRPQRCLFFLQNILFDIWSILIISEPSRPRKWIRLENLNWKIASRGPKTWNECISWQICDLKLSVPILCENCPGLVCRNWPGQFSKTNTVSSNLFIDAHDGTGSGWHGQREVARINDTIAKACLYPMNKSVNEPITPIYAHIWPYMAMYGHIWSYMAIYGHI